MADASALMTAASIMAAFGAAMTFFRINRELDMGKSGEINWIPWADWLLVAATVSSLLLVVVPLVLLTSRSPYSAIPHAAVAGAAVLVVGYIPAILAHYRFILGRRRQGERENPEPAEAAIVVLFAVLAAVAFTVVILVRLGAANVNPSN